MSRKPITFRGIRRGSATITDYHNAREEVGRVSCEKTENPAFLSSHADAKDIQEAQNLCGGCPFQAGCQFFAHTKVFKEFDGVMGGEVFYDKITEEEMANAS